MIASLALFFALPVLWPTGGFDAPAALVLVASLLLVLRWRWGVIPLIATAGLLGLLRYGLSLLPW